VSVNSSNSGITTSTSYDVLGNVVQMQSKQGVSVLKTTINDYDPVRHWLTGVTNKDGAGSVLSSFSYTRVDAGVP
jgi:hypothetical protein